MDISNQTLGQTFEIPFISKSKRNIDNVQCPCVTGETEVNYEIANIDIADRINYEKDIQNQHPVWLSVLNEAFTTNILNLQVDFELLTELIENKQK